MDQLKETKRVSALGFPGLGSEMSQFEYNESCCGVTSSYATTPLLFEQRTYQAYER